MMELLKKLLTKKKLAKEKEHKKNNGTKI